MSANIRTSSEKLHDLDKPKPCKINSLSLEEGDLLVLCGGFEDRAKRALELASKSNSTFQVLVIQYSPEYTENNDEQFLEFCSKEGISVFSVTYDRMDPRGFGESLVSSIPASSARIFIDISAMSRLLIVQVLVSIGRRPSGFSKCSIVYSEAEDYPPSREVAEKTFSGEKSPSLAFLSSGVFEITILPELSSQSAAKSRTRLIAFPSLDTHHVTSLIHELQPSRCNFIEGLPAQLSNSWRTEFIRRINGLDGFKNAEFFSVCTLDYVETLDSILNIYSNNRIRERIVISPTGSKMQTVAVGVLKALLDDIQIVYPTSEGYLNPHYYTKGIGSTFLISLSPFEEAKRTNTLLEKICYDNDKSQL